MDREQKTEVFEMAVKIARYYGFASLQETLNSIPKQGKKIPHVQGAKDGVPGEVNRPGLMKAYLDYNLSSLPQPVMIYHTEPLRKYMDRENYGGKDSVLLALEIIGVSRSIAEAILFKVALTIIEEAGFSEPIIEINSLGDRESIARFSRDFSIYYKKHSEEIPAHCRSNLKKDLFKVLECSQDKCMLFKDRAPKPINSLTELSRIHFTEVLEFLESMNVPYKINNCLVGGKEYYTRTIFEIQTQNEKNELYPKAIFNKIMARGGRFDDLVRHLGSKKDIPAVGITLSLGGLGLIPPKKSIVIKEKRLKVYLIHIGFEAKIKSLTALEILRKGKIPIYQSLSKDRLSAQIALAEEMKIPFMIIIGHKEALEESAIIRNMKNRSQETVPIKDLPHYVKLFAKE